MLKVSSPQPPMDDPMGGMGGMMPPMDMPPMGGPAPEPMPPMGGDPMGGEEKSYDADFDAGVDANEEEDPKKFIQQLTGKLTQSINKYNGTLPQPDVETDKYVASMVIAATTKGLSEKDSNEILKKFTDKTSENGDNSGDGDMDNDGGMQDMPMANESREQMYNRIISEVCKECRDILKRKTDIKEPKSEMRKQSQFAKLAYRIPTFTKD